MLPILEGTPHPHPTPPPPHLIPKILNIQLKKVKPSFSVALLLVIPNNERKTIVHKQVNHNNGICTKRPFVFRPVAPKRRR